MVNKFAMKNESELIDVGQILGAHGTDGALKIKSFTDVTTRFSPGNILHIQDNTHSIIESYSLRKDQLGLKLTGLNSLKEVEQLAGLWIRSECILSPSLDQNEFFHYQLIGLVVYADSGEELGTIKEIIQTGSNDVYLVHNGANEILLPAISQVIRDINLEEGIMTVKLMEGLR